jgi:VanZ family protein
MKFLRKYFSRIYYPIAWTIIVIVLLTLPGSMLPTESTFFIPNFDKLVHIGLFGGFVLLWCVHYGSRQSSPRKLLRFFFIMFLVAVAFGIGTEYVQKYFIPMRYYDEGDIIGDMMGAGIAYGIANLTLSNTAQSSPAGGQ